MLGFGLRPMSWVLGRILWKGLDSFVSGFRALIRCPVRGIELFGHSSAEGGSSVSDSSSAPTESALASFACLSSHRCTPPPCSRWCFLGKVGRRSSQIWGRQGGGQAFGHPHCSHSSPLWSLAHWPQGGRRSIPPASGIVLWLLTGASGRATQHAHLSRGFRANPCIEVVRSRAK